MSDVFRQTYLHFVWGTYERKMLLNSQMEAFLYVRLAEICHDLGLRLIAVNSAWNHMHCLVEWNCRVTYSDAVREMKSRTAREWNRLEPDTKLKWQRGYGVVSIRKNDVPIVVEYIRDQKLRHHQKNIWEPFEQFSTASAPDNVFRQTYLHIVWGTYHRKQLLEPHVESFVHARLPEICHDLGLQLIATNSAWDHTHCLVAWNSTVSFSDGVREMKSRTTVEWNHHARETHQRPLLKWQRGYGIVSIRKNDVPTVANYIRNQKIHHHHKNIWAPFEQRPLENDDQ